MNLRELEYLVAVDEERHFNRAAQRCFVSQPTLSGQLKKLEEELGVQLVERNTRQVMMTDVGGAVAAQARKVLMEAKGIREIAATYADPMAGELQMGLIPTIAPYLLPQIMPQFKARFPKLRFWLHERRTAVLLDLLREGTLDLMIQALPVEGDDFATIELFSEPFWLVVYSGHPLAEREFVTMEDLKGEEVMLLAEGHCLRKHALDVCLLAGALEDQRFHATSMETLRHMVGEGMGITLIPQMAIPATKRDNAGLIYIPFADPVPQRRIGLLHRQGSYREQTFHRLAAVIRELNG